MAGKTLHADVDGAGQGKGSGDLDDRQALLIALVRGVVLVLVGAMRGTCHEAPLPN